jgi:hypothetical protein
MTWQLPANTLHELHVEQVCNDSKGKLPTAAAAAACHH